MTDIDWVAIRADYIAGTMGYRRLADKYGVAVNALSEHAKKEGWREERQKYRDKRGADLVARYARMDKRRMEAVFRASEKMADTLDRMMQDPDQFCRYLVKDADKGELKEQTTGIYNTRAMKNTVRMLREMSALVRDLNRIPTQAQAEAQYIARRRLELEEERAHGAETEGTETGLIAMDAPEEIDA